jgi:uncharacterized delta-60 repeat protein
LLQPDGRIIAAGGNHIVRFNANGTVDTSFQAEVPYNLTNIGHPVLQPDGKLVVPGTVPNSPYSNNVAVSRLNTNGSIDSTFGMNGTATVPASAWSVVGAVVQEDGKIIVCFSTGSSGVYAIYYYGLVRLTKEGAQDQSFVSQYPWIYYSSPGIKPHAVAMGSNNVYVAAETISYPVDKRQPVTELVHLGVYATDGHALVLKPDITAPADVVVSNDPGVCTASHVQLGRATSTGACAQSITNNAPAVFPKGTTRVTWTVIDISDHTNTATQQVTVNDTEKPVLQVPTAQTFCGGAGNYSIPRPVYRDNCDLGSIV